MCVAVAGNSAGSNQVVCRLGGEYSEKEEEKEKAPKEEEKEQPANGE